MPLVMKSSELRIHLLPSPSLENACHLKLEIFIRLISMVELGALIDTLRKQVGIYL